MKGAPGLARANGQTQGASSASGSTGAVGSQGQGGQQQSKQGQYGLDGLTDIIKTSNKDVSSLALGVDLLTLGLNLNSKECLYPNFSSPFTSAKQDEPNFVIPRCYQQSRPSQLKGEHIAKVQLETLFYMFYSSPTDVLQIRAALELYRREWRYHTELKLWIKARSTQELMKSHPGVQFLYFDVKRWDTLLYTQVHRGSLLSGLLREEELRAPLATMQGGVGRGG